MCDLATAERGGDETEHALQGEAKAEVDVFGNLKGNEGWCSRTAVSQDAWSSKHSQPLSLHSRPRISTSKSSRNMLAYGGLS